jgi:hypothetical protein
VLLALAVAACGGGGGDDDTATVAGQPTTTTPAAPAGACGLKPMTFINERWQGSAAAPPAEGGVVWEQTITFSNPNTVPVRLSNLVVHLRLSGSGGYFLKLARSVARPVDDELVPAGRDQQRVLHVWLASGNTPQTEDLYATTSAKVGGADCPVPVERLSTSAVPAHVQALPSCEPLPSIQPC